MPFQDMASSLYPSREYLPQKPPGAGLTRITMSLLFSYLHFLHVQNTC